jgi:hypothetical protein
MRKAAGLSMVLVLLAGCGDSTAPTTADPLRTILFYSLQAGKSYLLNTDGSDLHALQVATSDSVAAIAVGNGGQVVAVAAPNAILVTSVENPSKLDTIISPRPAESSLGAFSPDGNTFAIVSYLPHEMLLMYDRVNHRLDTLDVSGANTAMAPVFSPDGKRVALVGATELALWITTVTLDRPDMIGTSHLGTSSFTHRPLFGWPAWTSDGVLIAAVHVTDSGPDTVLSMSLDPDKPANDLVERYRAVLAPVSDERPELVFGERSTYAYSATGEGFAIGAQPGTDPNRQAIYYVSRAVARVRLVLDDPNTFPEFPLIIN